VGLLQRVFNSREIGPATASGEEGLKVIPKFKLDVVLGKTLHLRLPPGVAIACDARTSDA